jgi:hypothetical protein
VAAAAKTKKAKGKRQKWGNIWALPAFAFCLFTFGLILPYFFLTDGSKAGLITSAKLESTQH